jgi:hypothetical protein
VVAVLGGTTELKYEWLRELNEGQGERPGGRAERGIPPDVPRGVEEETDGCPGPAADWDG